MLHDCCKSVDCKTQHAKVTVVQKWLRQKANCCLYIDTALGALACALAALQGCEFFSLFTNAAPTDFERDMLIPTRE